MYGKFLPLHRWIFFSPKTSHFVCKMRLESIEICSPNHHETNSVYCPMDSYEFRKLHAENLPDLLFLMRKVAKKHFSRAQLVKKYHTPWSNGQYHGYIAYEKSSGRPVGATAALPLRAVLTDGRELPITQLTDALVLPTHRGRGLMTRLTTLIMAAHEAEGTELFFVLPNQDAVHGVLKKMGFQQTASMQYHHLKINTLPLEALCRRAGFSRFFQWWGRRALSPFLAPEDWVMPSSVLQEGFAGILHDFDFFSYKIFTFNRLCMVSGIDCWLKLDSGLLVGDVALPENCADEQFDAWLHTLRGIARRAGLRQIIFQSTPASRLNEKLSARYRPNPSWAVCVRATNDSLRAEMQGLRFVYGDFDTF